MSFINRPLGLCASGIHTIVDWAVQLKDCLGAHDHLADHAPILTRRSAAAHAVQIPSGPRGRSCLFHRSAWIFVSAVVDVSKGPGF